MKTNYRNVCLLVVLMTFSNFEMQTNKIVKYLPLGDSYTICTGANEDESWPKILTEHLNKANFKTTLLANPARNGYTTGQLIDRELPIFKTLKPDFVTLLIGVNDWVQEVPIQKFEANLKYILNEIEKVITNKKIILITIPDFGVTPTGKMYGGGRNIEKGISEFNDLIKKEAKQRGLPLVDLFELSQKMGQDATLVAKDGLHPSAKEYAIWETLILPKAIKALE